MIFREAKPPLYAAAFLVGFFAIFHGYAHGTELPHAANPLAYGVGFVIATGMLHVSGIGLGLVHRWPKGARALRLVGAGDKQGYEGVVESTIKKYNSMIHTQSAVYCMVELAKQNKIDPSKVVSIEAEVFQLAYDFAGGGLYGVDRVIQTKEQADHSLPYLLAVALLDGDVQPAQFKPDRIAKPDVQALLKKVSVRPNHEYTEEYPGKMPAKIIVRLQDGKVIEHEVQDYPGLASRPFTWEDSVEKFDRLVAGRADDALSREIKDAVRSVENIQVRDLMKLLGSVKAAASAATSSTT